MAVTIKDNVRIWEAPKRDANECECFYEARARRDMYKFIQENSCRVPKHGSLNYEITINGKVIKKRLVACRGEVYYILPGCRNKGVELQYGVTQLKLTIPKSLTRTEDEVFYDNLDKLQKHLEVDGLWNEVLQSVKLARILGKEYIEELQKADDNTWDRSHFEENFSKAVEYYEHVLKIVEAQNDPKLLEYYKDVAKGHEIGKVEVDYFKCEVIYQGQFFPTPYLPVKTAYELQDNLKIKKMLFHKGSYNSGTTKMILQNIAEAINTKTKYNYKGFNGYDVSFEYNPETNKAWYSEEYVGCANGHYYLALNRTHAVFYETD